MATSTPFDSHDDDNATLGHSRLSHLPQEPTLIRSPIQPKPSPHHEYSRPHFHHSDRAVSRSHVSRRSHHHRRRHRRRSSSESSGAQRSGYRGLSDSRGRARSISSTPSRAARRTKPRSISRSLTPVRLGSRKRKRRSSASRGRPRSTSRSLTPVYSGHRYGHRYRKRSHRGRSRSRRSRGRPRSISGSSSPVYSGNHHRKIAGSSMARDHSFGRRSLTLSSSRSASKGSRERSFRDGGHSMGRGLSSTRSASKRQRNGPRESQIPYNEGTGSHPDARATPLSDHSKPAPSTPSPQKIPTPSTIDVIRRATDVIRHRTPLSDLKMSVIPGSSTIHVTHHSRAVTPGTITRDHSTDTIAPTRVLLTPIDSYIRSALKENVPLPHTSDARHRSVSRAGPPNLDGPPRKSTNRAVPTYAPPPRHLRLPDSANPSRGSVLRGASSNPDGGDEEKAKTPNEQEQEKADQTQSPDSTSRAEPTYAPPPRHLCLPDSANPSRGSVLRGASSNPDGGDEEKAKTPNEQEQEKADQTQSPDVDVSTSPTHLLMQKESTPINSTPVNPSTTAGPLTPIDFAQPLYRPRSANPLCSNGSVSRASNSDGLPEPSTSHIELTHAASPPRSRPMLRESTLDRLLNAVDSPSNLFSPSPSPRPPRSPSNPLASMPPLNQATLTKSTNASSPSPATPSYHATTISHCDSPAASTAIVKPPLTDSSTLGTLLALKRIDKVQEVRERLLRRVRPIIPLVQKNALPWNDLPILCMAKAVQITGIPDCCPLPGFNTSPRGVSGIPTRFLSLYLKHLPDDISQGIVFRRVSAEESDGMKAGKVPVIICNPPHPQSRHTHAKQLFIANNRMWVDRCGEPRPPDYANDSEFVPSDDDPHDPSLSSMSVNSKLIQGRPRGSRRPRRMPHTPTPTPTPSPDFSFSPDYLDSDAGSISSKGKGKARAHSRPQSDDEEEESRPSKRSRSTMKLRSRK